MSRKKWRTLSLKIKIIKFWHLYRWYLIGALVFLSLFLLLFPIMKKDWLIYPAPLRAQIALSYLLNDQALGGSCRESCQKERQQYAALVFAGGQDLRLKMEKALIASSTNPEIRRLLINSWQEADWGAPNLELLSSAPYLEQQIALVQAWPELAPADWLAELINRFYESKDDSERVLILRNLLGNQEPIVEELIKEIIQNKNYANSIKEEAYLLWANLPNKERAQALIDLSLWQEVLLSESSSSSLKESIIWGLAPKTHLIYQAEELKQLLKAFLEQIDDLNPHLRLATETILFDWLKLKPDLIKNI